MKPRRDIRFLVVDDMANMRRTIRSMLRHLGCGEIREEEDGRGALRTLQREPVDFIICDWNMPHMRGIDLLRKVREDDKLQGLPFLMVTAEVDETTIVQAAEEEVDGYIIKPFVAATLEKKIDAILERKANPTDLDRHLGAARELLSAGAHEAALAEVEGALRLRPESARARVLRGQVLEARGLGAEAEGSYREALERNPRYVAARDRLAELYFKAGEAEKAVGELEAAVQISPGNAERLAALARALREAGRPGEAEAALRKALELDPECREARGLMEMLEGKV